MSGTYAASLFDRLRQLADEAPDRVFSVSEAGEFTRAERLRRAVAVAAGLAAAGIGRGDHVVMQAENCDEALDVLFAANALGAAFCPIHVDLVGESLNHVLEVLTPSVIITDAARTAPLAATAYSGPHYVVGDSRPEGSAAFGDLLDHGRLEAASGIGSATAMILMTSGTTGRSKGVVISNAFAWSVARINCRERGITAADRLYTCFAFCHTNPFSFTLFPAMWAGAGFAWSRRFSASGFWDSVRGLGATQFSLFTTPMLILLDKPPSAADGDHGASACVAIGTPRGRGEEFEARFGIPIIELYGMTECGLMTVQNSAQRRLGSIGRAVVEWTVELHDADGLPVPEGEIGEIVGRPSGPHMMMDGYFADPAATLRSYEDLWFHTGDRGRRDADGFLWYQGRSGDVIRYRGENIAASDVEAAAVATGLVAHAAAIAIPSELGEDELLLVVEPGDVDAPALFAALSRELPRFAVPRHIRAMDQLPSTVTGRVIKGRLRAEGLQPDTWSATNRRFGR